MRPIPANNKGNVWIKCGFNISLEKEWLLFITWVGNKYEPKVDDNPHNARNNKPTLAIVKEILESSLSRDKNIGPWIISVTQPKDVPSLMAALTKRAEGCMSEFFVMKSVIKNKQTEGTESNARKYPTPRFLPIEKRMSGIWITVVKSTRLCKNSNLHRPCNTPVAYDAKTEATRIVVAMNK